MIALLLTAFIVLHYNLQIFFGPIDYLGESVHRRYLEWAIWNAVVAGELMLGLSTGRVNTAGIAVFALFLIAALGLLVKMLASVKSTGALKP